MHLNLDISFFGSALGNTETPTFTPESPYRSHLMIEESSEHLGVEFLERLDGTNDVNPICVSCRTLFTDVDYSALCEGAEFFIVDGGNLIGKGNVRDASM